MGKFKKGLFLGGLVGATLTWMSTTKKGQEVKEKILDYSAEVYMDLKDKLMASGAWDKITKQDFIAMVRKTVDKYAAQNQMAEKVKNTVVKLVSTQWKHLQKELRKRSGYGDSGCKDNECKDNGCKDGQCGGCK